MVENTTNDHCFTAEGASSLLLLLLLFFFLLCFTLLASFLS
jgi:hypothetical protein